MICIGRTQVNEQKNEKLVFFGKTRGITPERGK
jgi:hypothetical protein